VVGGEARAPHLRPVIHVSRQAALEEFAAADSDDCGDDPADDDDVPPWGVELINAVETLSGVVEETTVRLDEHQRADVEEPEIRWYQ
jgi:hypothetical protein